MTGRLQMTAAVWVALILPGIVDAQVLGTFRWQLQPYCNVVTLVVTQVGSVYRVEGTDDQCGASTSASVTGTAFPNRNGSIGLGLNLVTAPGGTASPIEATIALSTLNGTWRGPGGTSGAFAALTGTPVPGNPRPPPARVVVPPEISLLSGGSIVARPEGDSGIPVTGPGTRMMWYAHKGAFRSGSVDSDRWDDANIGVYSTALGGNTLASGQMSLASGLDARAIGLGSVAIGGRTTAVGMYSVALGHNTSATGLVSTALGIETEARGNASTAVGQFAVASGIGSFAGGYRSVAGGVTSLAFGFNSSAGGDNSITLGSAAVTTAAAPGSFVFADESTNSAFVSTLPNEFGARFAGGYYLYTRADLGTGVAVASNGSSWAALSDVNAKERFEEVDGEDLLARLTRVPIREWSYKAQDAGIRHMGPTAQDFRAAFGLGDFPLRINTIDADGVALAGVKALDARTRALQKENAALREALEALRREIAALKNQPGKNR